MNLKEYIEYRESLPKAFPSSDVRLSDLVTVIRDSHEWHVMWQLLASLPMNMGDVNCEDSETGECWQYMGSIPFEGKYFHEFRHRYHPKVQRRLKELIPASSSWVPQPHKAGLNGPKAS